jgi:hypothetical protein
MTDQSTQTDLSGLINFEEIPQSLLHGQAPLHHPVMRKSVSFAHAPTSSIHGPIASTRVKEEVCPTTNFARVDAAHFQGFLDDM